MVANLEHIALQTHAGVDEGLFLGELHIPREQICSVAVGELQDEGIIVVVLFV
ncbi:hypothetical protein SDC9_163492 [bioreactor metagenome]|uniref:Uncharacterized protein n=1 Tax=bioreactor metagenome TaxID=1076179 RepID=A0A645FVU5_9ZZZZ